MSNAANRQARDEARMGTRERLIEVAGQMFAAKGYNGTTAKEICERAGTNPAAVNYHFNGLDGLYEAVLLEARGRAALTDSHPDPLDEPVPLEDRLRVVIGLVVKALVSPIASSWMVGLFSRELTQATPIGRRVLGEAVAPRLSRVRALVGEYVGLPADDPRVALACLTVSAPLQLLLINDKELLRSIHPAIDLSPKSQQLLIDQFHSFAMAALNTLRTQVKG